MDECTQRRCCETHQTAQAVAAIKRHRQHRSYYLRRWVGDLCSSDGRWLGEMQAFPNVKCDAIDFTAEGDTIKVTRELDEEIEHIEMQTPAVLSVLSDMAQPRTCKWWRIS